MTLFQMTLKVINRKEVVLHFVGVFMFLSNIDFVNMQSFRVYSGSMQNQRCSPFLCYCPSQFSGVFVYRVLLLVLGLFVGTGFTQIL